MHHFVESPEILIGVDIESYDSRYSIISVEAVTDDAIVYVCKPLQPDYYGYDDDEVVGDATFIVILKKPILEPVYTKFKTAKKLQLRAMTQVDPSFAGFPEWKRIYADDGRRLDDGELDGLLWSAIKITSYKRDLHKAINEFRKPTNFTAATKAKLLRRAGNKCERCGSTAKLEADHIVPVAFGGSNQIANGWILCLVCHLEKSQAERRTYGLTSSAGRMKRALPAADTPSKLANLFLAELEELSGWSHLIEHGSGA